MCRWTRTRFLCGNGSPWEVLPGDECRFQADSPDACRPPSSARAMKASSKSRSRSHSASPSPSLLSLREPTGSSSSSSSSPPPVTEASSGSSNGNTMSLMAAVAPCEECASIRSNGRSLEARRAVLADFAARFGNLNLLEALRRRHAEELAGLEAEVARQRRLHGETRETVAVRSQVENTRWQREERRRAQKEEEARRLEEWRRRKDRSGSGQQGPGGSDDRRWQQQQPQQQQQGAGSGARIPGLAFVVLDPSVISVARSSRQTGLPT